MIQARSITKTYATAGQTVRALDDLSLDIHQGDFVVVHGASGSGKTTLLLALGGMLRPTSGEVLFQGGNIYSLSAWRRSRYRKQNVGFIFQKFFLVPYLRAYDNIRLGLVSRGNRIDHKERIADVAGGLGMRSRLGHLPSQLSVGEQQRIAMARAIVAEPNLILADEPTGNLDTGNAKVLVEFLCAENQKGRTIVLVTHDEELLSLGNRTIHLNAGRRAE